MNTADEGRATVLVWRLGWGWVEQLVEPEVVEDQAVEAESADDAEPAAA